MIKSESMVLVCTDRMLSNMPLQTFSSNAFSFEDACEELTVPVGKHVVMCWCSYLGRGG